MAIDIQSRNGQMKIGTDGELSTDTTIASVVDRTILAPRMNVNGEISGNRLWSEGTRINVGTNQDRLIVDYCTEALQDLVNLGYIGNLVVLVDTVGNRDDAYAVQVTYRDLTVGTQETLIYNWGV
jgi:hypothetical protein